MKTRISRFAVVLVLAAPLGACALADIGGGPAPQLFTLTAAHPAASAEAVRAPVRLLVDGFSAPAAIDTTRIVYRPSANEIKYYADGRWSDRAPKMIQMLAIETLENSGRFASVAASGDDLDSDYVLMGDIRQFAVEADGSATRVHLDFFMRLVGVNDRTIIASKAFTATVPVVGSGLTPIVSAYDAGLREVLDGITVWTSDEAVAGKK